MELYHSYDGSALLGGRVKKHRFTKGHVAHTHKQLARYKHLKKTKGLSPIQHHRYMTLKKYFGLGEYDDDEEMDGGMTLGGMALEGRMHHQPVGLSYTHAGALLGGRSHILRDKMFGSALLGGEMIGGGRTKGSKNKPKTRAIVPYEHPVQPLRTGKIKINLKKVPQIKINLKRAPMRSHMQKMTHEIGTQTEPIRRAKKSRSGYAHPPTPAQLEARHRLAESARRARMLGIPIKEAYREIYGAPKGVKKQKGVKRSYPMGYIINPLTNRKVSADSPTFRKLLREGHILQSDIIFSKASAVPRMANVKKARKININLHKVPKEREINIKLHKVPKRIHHMVEELGHVTHFPENPIVAMPEEELLELNPEDAELARERAEEFGEFEHAPLIEHLPAIEYHPEEEYGLNELFGTGYRRRHHGRRVVHRGRMGAPRLVPQRKRHTLRCK